MIHTGDCIEVMRTMPAASVDAVVTDPPYGLEFMGKDWDSFKTYGPGGKNMKPRGTGIEKSEDGKWQPGRSHGYRQKQPRCKRCGKLVGRGTGVCKCPAGADLDMRQAESGYQFQYWVEAWGTEALRVTKPGGYLLAFGGTRTHHRLVCGLEDAGWIIRDELTWVYASGFPKGKANLKPAHEPIVLARKPGPLRPLGIDAGRIGYLSAADKEAALAGDAFKRKDTSDKKGWSRPWMEDKEKVAAMNAAAKERAQNGRWPSNVLLSSPELFDEPNPEVVGSGATSEGMRSQNHNTPAEKFPNGIYQKGMALEQGWQEAYGDTGGYSRFFLIPKSARRDREPISANSGVYSADADNSQKTRVNTHPTCKPTDLMAHLIKLVCPTDGVILDPFLGSGSTAIAAERLGVKWIGIEKEPEYVAIAEARLNGTQRGLGLDVPAPIRTSGAKQRGNKDAEGQPSLGSKRAPHAVEGWGFAKGTPNDAAPSQSAQDEAMGRFLALGYETPDEEPAA